MSGEKPDIELIQERVANISIGSSTLRNQGAKGVVEKAREFLTKLDLRTLSTITEERRFRKWLDNNTEKLVEKLPDGAKNFGTARKALNVFLEEAFYNRFLSEEYNLHQLEEFLELPLDSYTQSHLRKNSERGELPIWEGIKYLTPEANDKFQQFARNLAKGKANPRIYLDLEFWR